MRFIVTFNNTAVDPPVQKVRLFKTLEEAVKFIKLAKKKIPNYENFKIKVIKY